LRSFRSFIHFRIPPYLLYLSILSVAFLKNPRHMKSQVMCDVMFFRLLNTCSNGRFERLSLGLLDPD